MFKHKFGRAALIIALLVGAVFCYAPSSRLVYGSSDNSLFRIAPWPSHEAQLFGDSVLLSDRVFPLTVYIVSLPDVGNVVLTNHSAILDGVLRAVQIHPSNSSVQELVLLLGEVGLGVGEGLKAALNVSVSYVLVQDWATYKTILEQGNDTIIVNTHDQYLPVPDGYTKEQWVGEIADFMLNRWGTWVHIGGYPFYNVWYQNGTTEQWGPAGYSRMMSHIGEPNATCYPAETYATSTDPAQLREKTYLMKSLEGSWDFFPAGCGEADVGYPVKFADFNDSRFDGSMFGYAVDGHAAEAFAQSASSFNFGVYVHLGTSTFYGDTGLKTKPDFPAGFIPTATAISVEYRLINMLYGSQGNSASEQIQKAINEGRTFGLDTATELFQKAQDCYAAGEYKMAWSYASEAASAAASSSKGSIMPLAFVGVSLILTGVVIVTAEAYRKHNGKKPRSDEET
ncbi:MAG: hypothetical protein ABSB28_02100 [Candidatus Bathyarchaeia archaeon]